LIDVYQRVQDTIQAHGLLNPGDQVVVGVSGGPDSLCLLHVLRRLRKAYRMHLHVAHLNHGTRGQASRADAEFVESIAAEWKLPVTVERQDVPSLAEKHTLAFEEAARRARYAFLAQVANTVGADKIAVGHNADDQAETVLMHFLRGSGLAGLRGMLPLAPLADYRLLEPFLSSSISNRQLPALIRPLLDVPRSAVESYCADHDLRPRFDRSNLDTTYFRNRLRHDLLPELETYNPNVRQILRHTAAVAAADYDLVVEQREKAWKNIVRKERADAIVFDQAGWQALPVALQRATLRQATYRLRQSLRDVTFVHVENARQIALDGETGKQATLPMGLALTVGYESITIGEAAETGPPPDEPLLWSAEPLTVPVPGAVPLPETDWVLEATILEQWDMTEITSPDHPWTAYLDAETLVEPVQLRTRLPSDRFAPHGMEGHSVKMSELMINLKIPAAWRDNVPLLVAGGEVAWVCGRRIAEDVTVEAETRQVARFRFERTSH
jgi:tRNA(Ile)-lysidine synthase